MKLSERIEGALMGHLVGDALGTPYEFNEKFKGGGSPPIDQIEMIPPVGYNRSHEGIPPGTWSDDGSQTLCLLETYLDCGKLDMDDFGWKLVKWLSSGYNTPDGFMFGSGGVTRGSLRNLTEGCDPESSGLAEDEDNGNGSLMRALPVALLSKDPWHDAMLQSKVTHGHIKSQLCCAIYTSWMMSIIDPTPAEKFDFLYFDVCHSRMELRIYLETHDEGKKLDFKEVLKVFNEIEEFDDLQGTSYVIDSLHSARKCVEENTNYEDTVKAAIAMGNDTDTTAAIAGSLAGALYGIEGIPQRWLDQLRGREILDPMLSKLLTT